jgi:hypothetical protein
MLLVYYYDRQTCWKKVGVICATHPFPGYFSIRSARVGAPMVGALCVSRWARPGSPVPIVKTSERCSCRWMPIRGRSFPSRCPWYGCRGSSRCTCIRRTSRMLRMRTLPSCSRRRCRTCWMSPRLRSSSRGAGVGEEALRGKLRRVCLWALGPVREDQFTSVNT